MRRTSRIVASTTPVSWLERIAFDSLQNKAPTSTLCLAPTSDKVEIAPNQVQEYQDENTAPYVMTADDLDPANTRLFIKSLSLELHDYALLYRIFRAHGKIRMLAINTKRHNAIVEFETKTAALSAKHDCKCVIAASGRSYTIKTFWGKHINREPPVKNAPPTLQEQISFLKVVDCAVQHGFFLKLFTTCDLDRENVGEYPLKSDPWFTGALPIDSLSQPSSANSTAEVPLYQSWSSVASSKENLSGLLSASSSVGRSHLEELHFSVGPSQPLSSSDSAIPKTPSKTYALELSIEDKKFDSSLKTQTQSNTQSFGTLPSFVASPPTKRLFVSIKDKDIPVYTPSSKHRFSPQSLAALDADVFIY